MSKKLNVGQECWINQNHHYGLMWDQKTKDWEGFHDKVKKGDKVVYIEKVDWIGKIGESGCDILVYHPDTNQIYRVMRNTLLTEEPITKVVCGGHVITRYKQPSSYDIKATSIEDGEFIELAFEDLNELENLTRALIGLQQRIRLKLAIELNRGGGPCNLTIGCITETFDNLKKVLEDAKQL